MGAVKKLISDDEFKIKYMKLMQQEYTFEDMYDDLGLSRRTLYRYMERLGLPSPPRQQPMPRKRFLSVLEYKRHKRDGLNDKEIAKIIGVSNKTLYLWKCKMGLKGMRNNGKVQRAMVER